MDIVEVFDQAGLSHFEADQVRQTAQEVDRQIGIQFADPFGRLRIIGAQQAIAWVKDWGAMIDRGASVLDQAGEFEGLGILGLEWPELIAVVAPRSKSGAATA